MQRRHKKHACCKKTGRSKVRWDVQVRGLVLRRGPTQTQMLGRTLTGVEEWDRGRHISAAAMRCSAQREVQEAQVDAREDCAAAAGSFVSKDRCQLGTYSLISPAVSLSIQPSHTDAILN